MFPGEEFAPLPSASPAAFYRSSASEHVFPCLNRLKGLVHFRTGGLCLRYAGSVNRWRETVFRKIDIENVAALQLHLAVGGSDLDFFDANRCHATDGFSPVF